MQNRIKLSRIFAREKPLLHFFIWDESDRQGIRRFLGTEIQTNLFIVPPRGTKGSVWYSEKKTIEEKIQKLESDATSWLAPMQEWVETASSIGKIAERNDLPSKKSSLQKIFGSNLILHDKKVRENPSLPYAALRAALQNFSPFQTSHIRVAEFGFAPKFQGYEPRELLLLYPADERIIYCFDYLAN